MTVIFPSWVNKLPAIAAGAALCLGLFVTVVVWYYFSPRNLEVGYAPIQPIPYSHKLHAGLMGMDCRYCHTSVEIGPHANVPPTQTCINCHGENKIRSDRPDIQMIQAAHRDGMPIEWVKVHMLPQFAYFNHAAHLRAGVGCASCHGRVDQMEIVRQVEPLSMGWCLECHRDPETHIRPRDRVTDMGYSQSEADLAQARRMLERNEISPPTYCSACHR